MKKIILQSILIFFSINSYAQLVGTSNNMNFQVMVPQYTVIDDHDFNADDECTLLIAKQENDGNPNNWLLDWNGIDGSLVQTVDPYKVCIIDDDNPPFGNKPIYSVDDINTGVIENASSLDFEYIYYEDDDNVRCDVSFSSDQGIERGKTILYAQPKDLNTWMNPGLLSASEGINDPTPETNITVIYSNRFAGGDGFNDALDFGLLQNPGQKTHTNSTTSMPFFQGPPQFNVFIAADPAMSYQNNYNGQSGADVTYKFEVPANGAVVSIENSNKTNFRHYLIDGDQSTVLAQATGSFSRSLCSGTYYLVVDGISGHRGDFILVINTDPLIIENTGNISTTVNALCPGTEIPIISGSLVTPSIPLTESESISYEWQYSDNDGATWNTLINDTGKDFINSGTLPLEMAENDISIRRRAKICNVYSNFSNVITFPAIVSLTTAGSIELWINGDLNNIGTSPYTVPANVSPGVLGSNVAGSGNPPYDGSNSVSYYWEKSENNGSSWTGVPCNSANPPCETYTIPGNLIEDIWYRRVAVNGCGTKDTTEEFRLNIIPANGQISGKVTAGSIPNISNVQGVTITAERKSTVQGGDLVQAIYTTTTDANGDYTLDGLYYGPGPGSTEFTVTPSKTENGIIHVFSPDSANVRLNSSTAQTANFTDETSFTVSGNVFWDFQSQSCGMENVTIMAQGTSSSVFEQTDGNGNYTFSLTAGTYTLTPSFEGHSFSPASITIEVLNNLENQDFEDTQLRKVSGQFTDGCDNYLYDATIKFTTSCFSGSFITTVDQFGMYSIDLPAIPFSVSLEPNSGDPNLDILIGNTFNTETIDLTNEDTIMNFIYRPPLTWEITGFPDPSCLGEVIMEQFEGIPLTFNIFEGELGTCPLDTGLLIINDGISDRGDTTLYISNGVVNYEIVPGFPNLIEVDDFLKNISFTAVDDPTGLAPTQEISDQKSVIVTGEKPREPQFTTTPEIPILILRDPPGDESYSEVSTSNTVIYTQSFFSKESTGNNIWTEVSAGVEFTTGLGYSIETEISANFGAGLTLTQESISSSEYLMQISNTQTFQTSADPKYPGSRSDLFIGGAMNIWYANSDIIDFDSENCRLIEDVSLRIGPNGFETDYRYTEYHIKNNIIKENLFLAENHPNPDSSRYFLELAQHWQEIIDYNEELKANANMNQSNISFNGGGNVEIKTTETTYQATESFEFLVEIDSMVAVEAGINIAGAGFSGGAKVNMRSQNGSSQSYTEINSFSTTYYLKDKNTQDEFTFDVATDPVYKTPVFRTLGGTSSCPHEEGTSRLNIPILTVQNGYQADLDPNSPASFKFDLRNDNLNAPSAFNYKLEYNSASGIPNPPNNVKVESVLNSNTFPVWNNNYEVNVEITKNASDISYPNLEFYLYPICYDNLAVDNDVPSDLAAEYGMLATQSVTAVFETTCSEIELFQPEEDWFITQMDEGILYVHAVNYDVNAMDQILVQYKKATSNNWLSSTPVPANEVTPNGALGHIIPLDVSGFDEGVYDVRIKLECSGVNTYTERARGSIDLTGPELFNQPKPNDEIYDEPNEIILAQFTEEINCNEILASLVNSNTGVNYAVSINCQGNIISMETLDDLTLLPDAEYTVTLSNIYDLLGNSGTNVSWIFNVGEVFSGPQVIYVNASAPAGGFGSSWDDAFNNLQDALDIATTDDQIWVAAGTYYPTVEFDLNNSGGGNIRERTFYLNIDVQLYGGFAGFETKLDQRDIITNPTILSGNFGETTSNADNALHVVVVDGTYGFGITKKCIIDGVTITKGFANQAAPNNSGGGIYNFGPGIGSKANPTISNTTIIDNYGFLGGGMFNDGSAGGESSPCVISSWLQGNTASTCAGVFNYAFNNGTSESSFINSVFYANEAINGGGAIQNNSANFGTINTTVINSTFFKNRASVGAGIYNSGNASLISNTTTILNSVFWDNVDELNASRGNIFINNSLLDDGLINGTVLLPANVSGTNNIDADPQFIDAMGGNLRLNNTSQGIDMGTADTTGLGLPVTDYDGLPRVNKRIDMGAFENPFVNCPKILYILPQYGDLTGSYEAEEMIYIEKGNQMPTVPVSINAPLLRISGDFIIPSTHLFTVNGSGCNN